jgi:uncharacterized damage-inducible protein DinB
MNDKEAFLNTLTHEVQTTVRVLKAYPSNKPDLKPAEICKTAHDLAFVFVAEQALANAAIRGALDFSGFPQVSGTIPEIIDRYQKGFEDLSQKIKAMPDADWNATMDFMVGPGKMDKVRRGDILWMTLHDMIHHRGQFSVYVRMAGGKVPSIYGPTAEEPWM